MLGGILLALVATSPAAALDGWVDLRGDRQEGRAGTDAYVTELLRSEGWVDERVDFSRALYLQIRYGVLREATWSRLAENRSDYETVTQLPDAVLRYQAGDLRVGLTADGYRRDYSGAGFEGRRDDRLGWGGWSQVSLDRLRLHARWLETRTWRDDDLAVEESDTRERYGTAGARLALRDGGEATYAFTENDHRDLQTGARNRTRQHSLQYRGSRALGRKVRVAWDARTSRISQLLAGPLLGGRVYLAPRDGGYLLDDTPESLDPLEPDLIHVGALFDDNRQAATPINIGDNATPVHEFGGDYRNLQLDFGARHELGVALLFVDRIVLFPELIAWRLFVTDDPEGRLWQELPATAATVTYREWDAARRGWEVVFAPAVEGRYFKMVNVKSGPTGPDLYITELEVYDRSEAENSETRDGLWRHRLDGELTWDPRPQLQARYLLSLDQRRYDQADRNLSGVTHNGRVDYRRGIWETGLALELQRLDGVRRGYTDVRLWNLNVARGRARNVTTTLAFSHQTDHSREQPRTIANYALQNRWAAAPALTWTQRLAHGRVHDPAYAEESRSWTLDSTVRAAPRPNLSVEMRIAQRWVSSEAGAGFQPFSDAQSRVTWSPRPLVSFSSLVRYQARESSDWLLRHMLSWNPLPGGSVELRLNLTDFDDERTDIRQRSAGGLVVWRPRARLFLEGGVEKTRFQRQGERSWPLNASFRANWTF
mgnify:FL=1